MSTLLYFLPRDNGIPIQSRDELVAAGCGHADPDSMGGRSNFVASGPSGTGGAMWSQKLPDSKDGPPPVYDAKNQTWRKHPGGKFWVGFNNDARPTPETLRRNTPPLGETPVTLLDGEAWIVPVCTPTAFSVAGSALPQEFDYDDGGELIAKTRRDFEAIASRVYQSFSVYVGLTPHPLTAAKLAKRKPTPKEQAAANEHAKAEIRLAADIVALNYRVGEFEAIALLKLFGSEEYFNVVRAAFEADAVDEALKDEAGNGSASDALPIDSGSTNASGHGPAASGAETIDSGT